MQFPGAHASSALGPLPRPQPRLMEQRQEDVP
jgi:hypothetical protein